MKILRDQTFWLGAMSAFAIVFFGLFVGMATDRVSFNGSGGGGDRNGGGYAGGGMPSPQPQPTAEEQMEAIAKDIKLNTRKFASCVKDGKYTQYIQDEIAKGSKAGAQGTPYSVIIKNGDVSKAVVINGAQPAGEINRLLDEFDSEVGAEGIEVEGLTDPDRIRGPKDATYTIIEYSDIDCPFCKRFHQTAGQLIAERSDVNWVYRHFPIPALHPNAAKKAEGAECANELGGAEKFWEYLDATAV